MYQALVQNAFGQRPMTCGTTQGTSGFPFLRFYVSTFLRFYVSTFLRFSISPIPPQTGLQDLWLNLQALCLASQNL